MTKLSNTTGTPFDSMSSEGDIRAALEALASIGDEDAIRALESETGVTPGRLVNDAQDLSDLRSLRPADGQMQLAVDLLARGLAGGAHLTFDGRQFWRFGGRTWGVLIREELKKQLLLRLSASPERYGDGKATTIAAGAMRALESLRFQPDFPSSPTATPLPVLALQDGEVWFAEDGDWELRRHRSWTRATALSPVRLEGAAGCPLFDGALHEIFGLASDVEAMVRHVLEIMAYAIQPRRHIPAIVVLRGGGANGKSFLLKILAALLAEDDVLWGSVARLSGDRFTLPDLAGRRIFIDDDAKDGARLDDGLLKAIAEDKPVAARRAHSPRSVSFRARALPIISTNGAPSLSDSSHGFERRLLVVPFARRFTEAEMDRSLADRIIADELPGVLNRLLDAYMRLCQRGHFEEPADCQEAKHDLLAASNPMRAFMQACCRTAEGGRVSTGALYETFQTWRRREGIRTNYSRKGFTERLKAMGLDVYKSIGRPSVGGLELIPSGDVQDLGEAD